MRQLRFRRILQRLARSPSLFWQTRVHRRIDAGVAADLGILSEQDEGRFLQSVETVATDFVDDISAVQKGDKTSAEFLEKFGHLRPRTYDILSEKYDAVRSSWFTEGAAQPRRKRSRSATTDQGHQ